MHNVEIKDMAIRNTLTNSLGLNYWKIKSNFSIDEIIKGNEGIKSLKSVVFILEIRGFDILVNIGGFKLSSLPGNRGVVVSTKAWILKPYQNRGIGTALNEIRYYLSKKMGYSIMLCTNIKSNIPQQKVLIKTGWQTILSFNNSRSKNEINMNIKRIR